MSRTITDTLNGFGVTTVQVAYAAAAGLSIAQAVLLDKSETFKNYAPKGDEDLKLKCSLSGPVLKMGHDAAFFTSAVTSAQALGKLAPFLGRLPFVGDDLASNIGQNTILALLLVPFAVYYFIVEHSPKSLTVPLAADAAANAVAVPTFLGRMQGRMTNVVGLLLVYIIVVLGGNFFENVARDLEIGIMSKVPLGDAVPTGSIVAMTRLVIDAAPTLLLTISQIMTFMTVSSEVDVSLKTGEEGAPTATDRQLYGVSIALLVVLGITALIQFVMPLMSSMSRAAQNSGLMNQIF